MAGTNTAALPDTAVSGTQVPRIKSADLFQHLREVEIDHQGRIYTLRLTQLNKLILTA
ncbi:MAG: hemin uptake protein HemP [Pseudomonadota bacterium]